MALADRTVTCRACGQSFAWSVGDQAYYAERGLVAPRVCGACATGGRRVSVPVTRERVLAWLRDDHLVPAHVSGTPVIGLEGEFRVTLQELGGSRAVDLPLAPEEALVVAIWLERDPDTPPLPATSPSAALVPPRGLAVCLEAVWPTGPAMAPRGYRLVLLTPDQDANQRLSTLGALGWILQDHTPLLIDEALFAFQAVRSWQWPPPPGAPLRDYLATLEALDAL